MTQYTFDEDLISDLHKDAYGFRPSQSFWSTFAAANPDQKQAIWDDLLESLEATVARERAEQQRAVKDFEVQLSNLLISGAKDFAMALRWLHEAYDTNGDNDYLEFRLGLPYGHLTKARIAAEDATLQ